MKYEELSDGEWCEPIMKGYKFMCCDCQLTHTMDFEIKTRYGRKYIRFRAFRDNRATALARRKRKKK